MKSAKIMLITEDGVSLVLLGDVAHLAKMLGIQSE